MERIKHIFLTVILSLQFIFASSVIPEDSFIRAGSVVEPSEKIGYCFFEVTQTKDTDSVALSKSKASDSVEPESKKLKIAEESNLEVKKVELPYIRVADPAYDQTFKRIFTWDNPMDGITGQDRLMSLLNSLFYPTAGENDFKIRKIEQLPNEVTKLNGKTPLGVLKFDIACRCSCYAIGYAHDIKIVDVEMQTGYQAEFQERLFDYGNKIRLANNHYPTLVLAFLNYRKLHQKELGDDESCWAGLFYKNLNTGLPIKPINDVVDTHSIDLSQKSIMLKAGLPIFVGGQCINNKTGKEWLKLLGIRHWATKDCTRYVIPDIVTDPAVKSALKMLSCVSENELSNYIEQESDANAMLQGAEENGLVRGKAEGKAEGLAEGKIETAKNMLGMGLDMKIIAHATGLPIEQIKSLKNPSLEESEDDEL